MLLSINLWNDECDWKPCSTSKRNGYEEAHRERLVTFSFRSAKGWNEAEEWNKLIDNNIWNGKKNHPK